MNSKRKRRTYILDRFGVVLFSFAFMVTTAGAQESTAVNPNTRDPRVIAEGASLFRGNCSPCHGLNGSGGGRGPDLTSGRWTHGSNDADIFQTITRGVPGTQMPANIFEDSETWSIIAYLRSLNAQQRSATAGDAAKGLALFQGRAGCSQCHMVRGRGGLLGPDLSRVGSARSAAYIINSVREPDKDLSDGMTDPNRFFGPPLRYDTVTVVTARGKKITGIAKNEDTYSIQLLDTSQHLQLLLKKDLKEIVERPASLMPAYPESSLSTADLSNLVAYLQTLTGNP
jgi:cytochrome c oxidase cbb3-type subunit 3